MPDLIELSERFKSMSEEQKRKLIKDMSSEEREALLESVIMLKSNIVKWFNSLTEEQKFIIRNYPNNN